MTKILYFAWLREKVGTAEEEVAVPAEVATVGALIDWLRAKGENYRSAFAQDKLVRCAVDQDFAGVAAPIGGAKEIAFFPPVTGG